MTREEEKVYKTAYDQAVREHPKGGGVMGAAARMFCARFAGDEAVKNYRRNRRKNREREAT